jgi:hypothetical protein
LNSGSDILQSENPRPWHGQLTIGAAWNGIGDPSPVMAAAEAAGFVSELLLAPMNAATADAARRAATRFTKVRVLAAGDTGIYSAWNKLVAACATSHIAFHGIDDLVCPDPAIAAALADISANDMLVASIQFATPAGVPTAIYHHRETDPPALSLGRHANPACPEICWPLTQLRAAGGLDEGFRIAGDVDLYFRVRPRVRRVDIDAVLVVMRDGGVSVSARHSGKVWAENRRIANNYGQKVPIGNLLLSGGFLNGRRWLYQLGGERFADKLTDRLRALFGKPRRYSLRAGE